MKRGGFLARRTRLARVSAKVKRQRPEYDAVYRAVDKRSQGRCEVAAAARSWEHFMRRCPARAAEHHHTRKPRRSNHHPELVIHLCRRHHDMASASYKNGRLLIEPNGDGTFARAVVTKESRFA